MLQLPRRYFAPRSSKHSNVAYHFQKRRAAPGASMFNFNEITYSRVYKDVSCRMTLMAEWDTTTTFPRARVLVAIKSVVNERRVAVILCLSSVLDERQQQTDVCKLL